MYLVSIYFDEKTDLEKRKAIATERNRIIQKIIAGKKSGMPTTSLHPSLEIINDCGDHHSTRGLLIVDSD